MSVFRRDRTAKPAASMPVPAGDGPVHRAERHERLAWRRDLYEMRSLIDEKLQAAVADGLQAYDDLCRARRDDIPGTLAEAQTRFDTAARLARARTDDRDRIDALIDTDFGSGSAAPPTAAGLARVRIRAWLATCFRKRRRPRHGSVSGN